jgi:uncharacterized membrane protein
VPEHAGGLLSKQRRCFLQKLGQATHKYKAEKRVLCTKLLFFSALVTKLLFFSALVTKLLFFSALVTKLLFF